MKISEEATCITYNGVIKYANEKFCTLFFNNENFDFSNTELKEMIPSAFFDDNEYSSKLLSFELSYKKATADLIFNKIKTSQNEFLITIYDVSFAKNLKQEADYLEENIITIVNESKEIKELLAINDRLEAETKELIDTQNKKYCLKPQMHLQG